MLVNGEKLLDKHINLEQRVLKSKYPKINGPRLTLLQDKPHKDSTEIYLTLSTYPIHRTGYRLCQRMLLNQKPTVSYYWSCDHDMLHVCIYHLFVPCV